MPDQKENYSNVRNLYSKLQKEYINKEETLNNLKKNKIEDLLKKANLLETKMKKSQPEYVEQKKVKIIEGEEDLLQNEIMELQ